MSCPDRFELLAALEEKPAGLREHLAACARCRAVADEERALSAALLRLRDPAAPAGLLEAVLARAEALDLERARARRQLAVATAVSAALALLLVGLFGRSLVGGAVTGALELLSDARVAAAALGRTLGPWLERAALVLLTVEAAAAVTLSLLLHRFSAALRLRS